MVQINHSDRRPRAGKRQARAFANARPSAGNESDFLFEPCTHTLFNLADRALAAPVSTTQPLTRTLAICRLLLSLLAVPDLGSRHAALGAPGDWQPGPECF